MSSKSSRLGIFLTVILFLIPFSAFAHGGHGHKACKADVEQFCSQVQPGEGRILACLKEHQSQLQPACQEKLPQWEKFQQMKQTCQADREKYCGQATHKEMRECMKQNHDLLSEQCRAAMDELKAMRKTPSST
jgi:hypothetical protein